MLFADKNIRYSTLLYFFECKDNVFSHFKKIKLYSLLDAKETK